MKKSLLVAFVCLGMIPTATFAQKKYEKLFYKTAISENNGIKIELADAVSLPGETKFKIKITNTTNDYLLFKPEESTFMINGKEVKPTEKWMIIDPNSSDNKTLNAKGTGFNDVKTYSFNAAGFYFLKLQEGQITAPEFKLPPTKNDFKAGPFDVSMLKMSKESAQTSVKFKTTYNGNNFGFVMPSRTAVRMPDGNEYANSDSKMKVKILKKGESDSYTLNWERLVGGRAMDMQLVEMFITWNNVFVEAIPESVAAQTLNLEWDEALTEAKK